MPFFSKRARMALQTVPTWVQTVHFYAAWMRLWMKRDALWVQTLSCCSRSFSSSISRLTRSCSSCSRRFSWQTRKRKGKAGILHDPKLESLQEKNKTKHWQLHPRQWVKINVLMVWFVERNEEENDEDAHHAIAAVMCFWRTYTSAGLMANSGEQTHKQVGIN